MDFLSPVHRTVTDGVFEPQHRPGETIEAARLDRDVFRLLRVPGLCLRMGKSARLGDTVP